MRLVGNPTEWQFNSASKKPYCETQKTVNSTNISEMCYKGKPIRHKMANSLQPRVHGFLQFHRHQIG